MTDKTTSMREKLILAGTSPRQITSFIAARFAASEIPEKYAALLGDTHRACIKKDADRVEFIIAHTMCIGGLLNAVAHGDKGLSIILARAILDMMERQNG